MIKLYHAPGSCSLAVKIALKLANIEFDTININVMEGEHLTEKYKQINPLSKVPALVKDEGTLTEGAAILQYIAEYAPESALLPATGTFAKAEALKWMMFVYSNLHPHWARAFVPTRYGQDEASIKRIAEEHINALYDIIEVQLASHKFLAGDVLSVADLYLVVATHWQGVLSQSLTERRPNLQRYINTLLDIPIINECIKSELM